MDFVDCSGLYLLVGKFAVGVAVVHISGIRSYSVISTYFCFRFLEVLISCLT